VLTGEEISLLDWLSGFQAISLAYSPDLDDRAFREAIVQMLEQLRNLPDYRELARTKTHELLHRARAFPLSDDFAAGYWWDLFEEALGMARQTLDDIESSPALIREFQDSKLVTDQQMLNVVDVVSALVTRLEESSGRSAARWDEIVEAGRQMDPVQFPRSVHAGKDPVKKEIKEDFVYMCRAGFLPLVGLVSDQIKRGSSRDASFITGYPAIFTTRIEAIRNDLERSAQAVARFMEVVLLLDQEFKRRRFGMNAIQFSDIEHGAHQLLKQAEIREVYLSKFKEIYVDEYQDTSSIQDAIIRGIAQDNLLMVGDIKQSIYRFRYANPDLFAGHQDSSCLVKANEAPPALDSRQSGYLALLNRCFRSRPPIIGFINDFFSSFLTKQSGEIDYDETQQLFADDQKWRLLDEEEGSTFPANVVLEIATGVKAEAGILEADIAAMSPAAREGLMALRVIGELRRKGVPYDRIAILLPTNENCRDCEEVLVQYGIPVTTRSGEMYPDNLVFRQLEALFSVLDNPRQDFALLSVLLGPFAPQAWSGEELVQVARLSLDDAVRKIECGVEKRQLFFHDRIFRLCEYADHPLAKKAEVFINRIEH
ncbi:MAG: UvrD-helicase domain-containing protein, partial [Clostridiaceae bacterium]|nr:UvrD-helicase domain-containing protein [Clostridiaceae bacterium]